MHVRDDRRVREVKRRVEFKIIQSTSGHECHTTLICLTKKKVMYFRDFFSL